MNSRLLRNLNNFRIPCTLSWQQAGQVFCLLPKRFLLLTHLRKCGIIKVEVINMAKQQIERERLSIDVLPTEHRQIKVYATLHGKTIRDYILESVRERLRQESEEKELSVLSTRLEKDPILKKLWDNKKDAAYDKL
ncbi:MAG: hypothetical protein AUJ85_02720 [Elusimicrobia bacterium CG1_02_37_114]|nr:MAG: hypothetical protein AUJ85_02720 [Elusimicrobia bacterium CG1_02_37_114]PIV53170.1 MAG: hypothetical protein COS17_05270 [Elusimicrobia bacterium CG02_land_8_20_14_3_00_37_13]